ncbi:DNA replication factor C complex subunit Rfc1 [Pseudogymnoascus australis]
MPQDIRNFFGGKGAVPAPKKDKVNESDGDENDVKKIATPKKAAPKKPSNKTPPKGEETTTSDYFASRGSKKVAKSPPEPTKLTALSPRPKTKSSTANFAAKKSVKDRPQREAYKNAEDDDRGAYVNVDDPDEGDDIFAAAVKTGGRRRDDDYMEIDSDKDEGVVTKASQNGKVPPRNKKRKSLSLDPDDSDEFDALKTGSKVNDEKKPPTKKPRGATKKEIIPESAEMQAVLDSIPTVEAPPPPSKSADGEKFNWRKAAAGGGNSGPPPGASSKEIPVGADNCLAGLTFVFTGLLETISREEGQELVKKYGGKVTGAPSGKTSYVVLGSDAGPSKLEKIANLKIKTINEDGLFALVRATSEHLTQTGGTTRAAEKALEKQKEAEKKMKIEAEEEERQERMRAAEAEKAARKVAESRGLAPPPNKNLPSSQLWTVKYAPSKMNQICGNKGQVDKIQSWLQGWPKAHKLGFQLPGKDGLGIYRSIVIYGPPGIGKTTAAHLASKLEGYDVIESNASDTRSKKLVESGLQDVLNNSSLLGFFAGHEEQVDSKKKKIVLIMDEVDGMSAGDRGGVGALAKICKKTDIPIILICNEFRIPKMNPFRHVVAEVPFRRPTVDQVRSRVATICHREGLKLSREAMDALIEGSNKDIRQVVNMLSSAKLDQTAMDFDQTKSMSKQWEKHLVLKPWDICHKLLGSGMFAPSSKSTLNDKIELYFNDHEFSYLMIQENYLRTRPLMPPNQNMSPREQRLKTLELADKAAESISDGDLVDRMIHGSQQQWSLMPVHAVFSSVRPASFMSGAVIGEMPFTTWLGNNSKHGKLSRFVKEIQSHMRLRTSGDRHEIRQQYLPTLWTQLIKRLETEGKDSVDEVIDLMDSYFLTRDDFDSIMELGVGPQRQELVTLETQTKSTFTRLYNSRTHPMPFMKASNVVAPAKTTKEMPDLEEAIEESDSGEALVETPDDNEDDDMDLSKDKYIKKPKAKKAAGKKPAAKKPKKTDDADDTQDEGRPKKPSASKPKATSAKTKAKKQNDDPQPASAIQEENMPYSIPGSRPQQTLTRTMLNTYALMRGRLERGGQGPLYQEGFTYNPWEPRPEDDNPKLSPKILWETFDHEDKERLQKDPTPDLDGARVPRVRTLSEKLGQIGYVKINGKVTDPDSKTDVLNALNGNPSFSPRVPGFHGPLLANVMNNAELHEFYTQFLHDVDNENDPERDYEGNPLNNHITAPTFLQWAAGAQKKGRLNTAEIEEEVVERARQQELKGAKPPGNHRPLVWSALKLQYDEESGGTISPAYSVDEHPSPLMSPRGKLVAFQLEQHTFYHMLPGFNVMLARAAFHDGGIDLSPTASSETEIITDVSTMGINTNLANTGQWQLPEALGDGDRELGFHRIDMIKVEFETLMAERDVEVGKATEMMLRLNSARDTVTRLGEMIFARRHEMTIPRRRARANQFLDEWKEYLRQQTARAVDMRQSWGDELETLRDVNLQRVRELQDLDQDLENNGSWAEI